MSRERTINPVLRRELAERWRGRRAVVTLTAYLGVLGLIMYLLYRLGQGILDSQFGFGALDPAASGPSLGRFLMEGLLFFVMVLVLFVAPGYAAAQLSGERERRTLTLLQVTLLRPWQIVAGKLGASTAWLTLLVTAALPLGAAAFFLGGVALGDLLRGIVAILAIAICTAAMAIGISSLTKRTTASIVITYALVLALTGGTAFVAVVEAVARTNAGQDLRTPIALYLNPFFGLADAVHAAGPAGGNFGLPSPLGLIAETLPGSQVMGGQFRDVVAVDGPLLSPEGQPIGVPLGPVAAGRALVWLKVVGLYALLGLVGLVVATRRMRTGRPVRQAPGSGPSDPEAVGVAAVAGSGDWEQPK